jgi:hypothetical protein
MGEIMLVLRKKNLEEPKPGEVFFTHYGALLLTVGFGFVNKVRFYDFRTGLHETLDLDTFNSFLNDNTYTCVNLHLQERYNILFPVQEKATFQDKNTNYLYSNGQCLYYYDRSTNTLINITTQSIPSDKTYKKERDSLLEIQQVISIQIYDEEEIKFEDLSLQ